MTKYVAMLAKNFTTPKAAARWELLFNKPATGFNLSAFLHQAKYLECDKSASLK